jgi:hypothetical protein
VVAMDFRGYYARNPLRWYLVKIWDFEIPIKADSHGAARYECWLNFSDAYDLKFGEFCKQSRVVRAS